MEVEGLSSRWESAHSVSSGLTAVLDIGKTKCALVLLDDKGEIVVTRTRPCSVVKTGLRFPALDTVETQTWFRSEMQALGELKARLRRIIVTTHGAALAAVRDDALVFPVPDYEWSGFEELRKNTDQSFDETLSPLLPRGLNLGIQLDWLEHHHPELMAEVEVLMPYPQYWAFWLSGIASSEVSSLGCHTLLWNPHTQDFSNWARTRAWSSRFAPRRRAWETLGTVRQDLADELGLPRSVQVHVGAHDSNACMAQYLRNWPRMTLVSSGTWAVVMTPGSSTERLHPSLDQLGNVSVRGESVPTGRFMGGREFARLCAGADPYLASMACVEHLLRRGLRILPGFESQGGPFAQMSGEIWLDGRSFTLEEWRQAIDPAERAAAAALYAAYVTAWLIKRLGGFGPIVVDGPFAKNRIILEVLAALFPQFDVYASDDSIDGTVRGSWTLTRWTEPGMSGPRVRAVTVRKSVAGPLLYNFERWPGHHSRDAIIDSYEHAFGSALMRQSRPAYGAASTGAAFQGWTACRVPLSISTR